MGKTVNEVNGELTYQAKYDFSLEREYPEIQYLLYDNGVGTFPRCNLQAIFGKAKSGKTFTLSILVAALLGDTSFGYESKMSDDEKVLFIDTEQDESDVAKVVQRIHIMLGWDPNRDNARLKVCILRTMPLEKRLEYIENKIKVVKPAAVFIDGIADLIYDINDIKESNSTIIRLMQLSTEFNCAICCTLHINGNEHNDKMRGHLGTTLKNKASDGLLSSMMGSTFEISHQFSRHEKIGKKTFFIKTVKDKALPAFHESYQTDKDSEKNEDVYKIATEICKPREKCQSGELKNRYLQHTHKKESSFYRFLEKCVECEFLKSIDGEGNTKFYELIEQSKDADEDLQDEDAPESNNIFYCSLLGADTTGYKNVVLGHLDIEAMDLKEAKRKAKEFLKLSWDEKKKVATFIERFYKPDKPVRLKIRITGEGKTSEINEPKK